MAQAVIIKSSKYGLNIMLDEEMPFDQLLEAITLKFKEAGKFFKGSSLGVCFEGRTLTSEEERVIINTITSVVDINILCVIDKDEERAERMLKRIQDRKTYLDGAARASEFYHGTLRSGQVLDSEQGVVIVGDVEAGAKIVSAGNIVVLGSLKGYAFAGSNGDSSCFVAALDMEPVLIQIGDVIAKSPDKKIAPAKRFGRRDKTPSSIPQIAVVRDGGILVEPIMNV